MTDYASADGTEGHGEAPHLCVKVINQAAGHNVYAIVFDKDDEVISGFIEFAKWHDLKGAHFTGIGGFKNARLGWFDREAKAFRVIPVDEPTEVLSITGNIAFLEGKHLLHAHCVLGRDDGSTIGGHLFQATVFPTLEIFLCEEAEFLIRKHDDETRLPLMRLEADTPPPESPASEPRLPEQENP